MGNIDSQTTVVNLYTVEQIGIQSLPTLAHANDSIGRILQHPPPPLLQIKRNLLPLEGDGSSRHVEERVVKSVTSEMVRGRNHKGACT